MKIISKLILLFIAVSLLTIVLSGVIFFASAKDALSRRIAAQLESVVTLKESQLNRFILVGIETVKDISGLGLIRDHLSEFHDRPNIDKEAIKAEIIELLNKKIQYTEFFEFSIILKDGKLDISTNPGNIGKVFNNEKYFIQGKKGVFVQNFYYDVSLHEPAITISSPIIDRKGKVAGILAGRVRMKEISDLMIERNGLGRTGETYLVNKFNFVVSELKKRKGAVFQQTIYSDVVKDCLRGNQNFAYYDDYAKDKVIGFYKWIPEREVGLFAQINLAEAFLPVDNLRWVIFLVGIGLVIFNTILGAFIATKISKPIIRLRDAAIKIGKGNFDTQIKIKTNDEIGELAGAFNQMTGDLKNTTTSIDNLNKEIDERRRTEAILADRESELRKLFESIDSGVVIYEAVEEGNDFIIKNFNPGAEKIENVSKEQVIGRRVTEVFLGIRQFGILDVFKRVWQSGNPEHYPEAVYKNERGLESWRENWVYKLPAGSIVAVYNDITARKKAEVMLLESKQQLSDIINFLPDATFVIDAQEKVIAWNKACEKLTGVKAEDMIGKGGYEYALPFYGEKRPLLINFSGKLAEVEREYLFVERQGDTVTAECFASRLFSGQGAYISIKAHLLFDTNGKVVGGIETIRDITSRKQAEEELKAAYDKLKFTQAQLVQSEKLEAVGRIASGVAHEVKNPLGIVLQSVNYLENNFPSKEKNTLDVLEVMKSNIKRADRIIRGLVDFSRIAELRIRPENINTVLEGSLLLIQHKIKQENIEPVKELSSGLPQVLVDKGKMEQVFINLFLNAVQAMPKGGRLSLRSSLSTLNKAGENIGQRSIDYFAPQEKVVLVEIEDTGIGIAAENISKVFDPFFTTKEPGSGTGLGLSVSKNIIDLHKALIDIQSQEGKGTKVTVILKIA